jgi:formylmethanofuran dehydrogenase subunit D
MNYGIAKGLAYRENWNADIQNEARHYQFQKQRQQEQQQEASFWANMLKQSPPQNDFDRKGYEEFAKGITGQITDIVHKNPNWKYDVKSMMDINNLSSQLMSNEYLTRDKAFQEQVKNFNKYHDDNPTDRLNYPEEYSKEAKRIYNYKNHGNADADEEVLGPDGKPMIKEYDFMHPVEINVLDEQLKLNKLKDSYGKKDYVKEGDVSFETTTYAPEDKLAAAGSLYQDNKGGWDRLFNTLSPEMKDAYNNNPIEYIYKEKVLPTFQDKKEYKGLNKAARTSVHVGERANEGPSYFNSFIAPNLIAGGKIATDNNNVAFLDYSEKYTDKGIRLPIYNSVNGQVLSSDGKAVNVSEKDNIHVANTYGDIQTDKQSGNSYMTCDIFIPGSKKDESVIKSKYGNNVQYDAKYLGSNIIKKDDNQEQGGSSRFGSTFNFMSGGGKPEGVEGYMVKGVKLKLNFNEQNKHQYEKMQGGTAWANKHYKAAYPEFEQNNTQQQKEEPKKDYTQFQKQISEKIRKSGYKMSTYKDGVVYGRNSKNEQWTEIP